VIDFILTAFFVAAPAAPATATPRAAGAAPLERVTIHADKLQVFNKQMLMVWTGNVEAQRGTTHLKCDQAIATYTDASRREVSRIQCSGRTVVTDGDRWAKGEHADFDNVAGLLTVTGQPQARQGVNRMKGSKVIFNLVQDTVEVENARAVFNPTPEQGKIIKPGGSKP
jgi:lipopolysaccharide export system protein LptA